MIAPARRRTPRPPAGAPRALLAALAREYHRVHAQWVGAGGIAAAEAGDARADTLLATLGDIDDAAVRASLCGWSPPAWARWLAAPPEVRP